MAQVEDVQVIDGEWILFAPSLDTKELPDEFYLRELESFDFHSPIEPIAELIAEWGLLAEPYYAEWGDATGMEWEQRSLAQDIFRDAKKYKDHPHSFHILSLDASFHHMEARTHLDALRFLREAWLEYAETGAMAEYAVRREIPEHQVWQDFLATLNRGLRAGHPSVIAEDIPGIALPGADPSSIYGASCVQIYNHMAMSAEFKFCANETCGRPFVRQRGDAQYKPRSEGVKYCSPACGKAQNERERRRRRAAEKKQT